MFEYTTVVSYSKLNRSKQVPLYEIMNYMQDCSTFQSETLGVGIDYMKEHNKAWMLLAYKIQKIKPLSLGQKIIVGTTPTEFGKLFGERQFYIKDEQGEFLYKAQTIWALVDMSERKPIRIEAEDMKMYTPDRAFEDIPVSRKMQLSKTKEEMPKIKVLRTYIDSNGHMNNTDYLRAAAEYIPTDFEWREMEIVYQKEVMEGNVMVPFVHQEAEGIGISFESEQGEVLTKIRIK